MGDGRFPKCQLTRTEKTKSAELRLPRLDEDEFTLSSIEGSHREANVVNESGLYSLIMTSRKPAAKKFKKWVTSEVLPLIRKTGNYGDPFVALNDPAAMRGLLLTYSEKDKFFPDSETTTKS